ncbi:MAG: bifunctional transaldolase/phosoglucose isomerase [Actinomycetota bacterium]|nr:bifunctional transaldolase/phosoglucose isomerase [Actinomycetota bacterium]
MGNPLHQLQALGQSVWYDNIRRALLTSGELERYRHDYAVSGVTSNPTIFERAISGSDDYDEDLRTAIARGVDDAEELFWGLAVDDIREAADVFREVFDRSDGADGYVSLELPPRLSHDTEGSIELGEELFGRVDRPNVMIKVPGTAAGVPAIEELIFRGVNVNVTLLFSVSQWRAVAESYMRGLEHRQAHGDDLDVASVASFFISRIDGKANDRLPDTLRNRLGITNAQLAYSAYHMLLGSPRWEALADAEARPQRLLWASTSTKDPKLSDTFYVEALVAPGTVNTMPESTLVAFAKHGTVGTPLSADDTEAREVAQRAEVADVDLDELGRELQEEGDEKFADSFRQLLGCIEDKVEELEQVSGRAPRLGPVNDDVASVVEELAQRDAVRRLWGRDHTLWQQNPTEVADRLGWLTSPEEMEEQADDLRSFAKETVADGLTHALVLGMGGTSLFPIVIRDSFPTRPEALELHVLDCVDPAAVARVEDRLPRGSTLVIASSQSGTTAETRLLLEWFWDRWGDPQRFAVITAPGTELAHLARERGFRAVFENRHDIGGRYSALSYFGLVPAALAGADVAGLLRRAGRVAAGCAGCVDPRDNPAVQLGATLAGAARAGHDKLTVVAGDRFASFGLWIEHLIAESTGKQGTGIVPVVGEPIATPSVYGDDRLFVGLGADPDVLAEVADAGHPVVDLPIDDPVDLGGEVMRWQIATALAGATLGINPFDQPDVGAAKDAARAALENGAAEVATEPVAPLLEQLAPGDYLAIQAYVDPEHPVVADLERARIALRDRHRVATTLGIGPRYLHRTGQLHKGGPNTGVFVQVVGDDENDPQIPGQPFGFAALKRAQAAGDLQALRDRGRRAGRVDVDELLNVADG